MDQKELKKYVLDNINTIAWSAWWVFVLLGSLVFLIYYASIGYFPEFNLSTSITLIGTAAITFIVIMAVLIATMIMPGFIWGTIYENDSKVFSVTEIKDKENQYLRSGIVFTISWVVWFAIFPTFYMHWRLGISSIGLAALIFFLHL